MNKIKRLQLVALVVALIAFVGSIGIKMLPTIAISENEMYSSHMILMDVETGKIINEQGKDETIYPASLTKIMTALVAIELLGEKGLNQIMVLPESIFQTIENENASVAGFLPGEKVKAQDLLYGMMLSSGADGALGLAVNLKGGEEEFVQLMNEKAKSLGMNYTHFTNVTGLHNDNHYSTLSDLALLLYKALDNETFRKVFTASMYETGKTNMHPDGMLLESTLFGKMSVDALEDLNVLGGKTGFTYEAGLCLATLANVDGKEYILITAGAKAQSAAGALHIIDAVKVYSAME